MIQRRRLHLVQGKQGQHEARQCGRQASRRQRAQNLTRARVDCWRRRHEVRLIAAGGVSGPASRPRGLPSPAVVLADACQFPTCGHAHWRARVGPVAGPTCTARGPAKPAEPADSAARPSPQLTGGPGPALGAGPAARALTAIRPGSGDPSCARTRGTRYKHQAPAWTPQR